MGGGVPRARPPADRREDLRGLLFGRQRAAEHVGAPARRSAPAEGGGRPHRRADPRRARVQPPVAARARGGARRRPCLREDPPQLPEHGDEARAGAGDVRWAHGGADDGRRAVRGTAAAGLHPPDLEHRGPEPTRPLHRDGDALPAGSAPGGPRQAHLARRGLHGAVPGARGLLRRREARRGAAPAARRRAGSPRAGEAVRDRRRGAGLAVVSAPCAVARRAM